MACMVNCDVSWQTQCCDVEIASSAWNCSAQLVMCVRGYVYAGEDTQAPVAGQAYCGMCLQATM